jgi:AcrR family transcriptional regulator
MSSIKNDNVQKAVRPVGRPALVDAQAILDAALAIGLDQVTMKAVADRLGVGISTLYQYVKNRSELVRLAALRQIMARCPPQSAGQHWAEVAIRYAEDLLKTLIDEPQLIVELMKGGLGPQVEADILERFLGEMQGHGFSAEDGIRFYRSISMVTIGAAVGALNYAAAQAAGAPHELEIKRILAERRADELPLIRQAIDEYQREDIQIWFTALHELLAGVAASRKENLPPTLVTSQRVTLVVHQCPAIPIDNLGTSSVTEDSTVRNPNRRNLQ